MSALKFHKSKNIPVHQLPFVERVPGRPGLSFWAVPPTGGYCGGCETGKALANLYLKHLRAHGASPGGSLQSVVLDMMDQESDESPEAASLRGQIVGFFSVLDHWLEGSAKLLGQNLDRLDERALLATANAGVDLDEEAYLARLEEEEGEA